MKTNHVLLMAALFLNFAPLHAAPTTIDRAKTLVRGAQMYREQTLPRLYEFLEISGLGRSAQKLKNAALLIEQLQTEIETKLQQTLPITELTLRQTNKSALDRQQIFMNAKVLDEINKLFNALDNIMSNLAKEVRDYRQIQKQLEPVVEAVRKELTALQENSQKIAKNIQSLKKQFEPQLKKLGLDVLSNSYDAAFVNLAPEVLPLRNQLEQFKKKITQKETIKKNLESLYLPTLKESYKGMEKEAKGLFNLTKTLGVNMTEKAGAEQTQVEQYQKSLDEQKTKFTNATLLKKLTDAQNNYVTIMEDIQKEIATLSESEQRLWGILTDLYQRVLLTEAIIMRGSTTIQQWTLPKILGINPPEIKK